jgi:hypothetical protein
MRILDEIAGDLEELRAELIRRGRSPEAADAEAIELLAPSPAALAALVSVHESLYRSLVRRFSGPVRAAEWLGLVGVTTAALALAFGTLARSGVLRDPSLFLAPVLATGVAIVALAGKKAIHSFLERDRAASAERTGLPWLPVGSGLAVLLAFAGVVYEFARLAQRVEAAPEHQGALLVPWLLDTSVLVASGLTVSLVGGLCWFVLSQRVAAAEAVDARPAGIVARRSVSGLSLDTVPPTNGART